MFRASASLLFTAPQQRTAATLLASSSVTAAAASSTKKTPATKTRRPANVAPTWFTNQTPAESSSNLKFIAISMRQVEVKSSDLLARPSDKLMMAQMMNNKMNNNNGVLTSSSSSFSFSSPAPVSMEYDIDELRRIDHSNTVERYISTLLSNTETDTTFGDPSGGETLQCTQPIQLPGRKRSPWGKTFFGKIFHQPRNFAYQTSTFWSKKFGMKKHRYKKRWQKRRYKVAALANLPFAKRLRVNMIPKLQQGKKKKTDNMLDLDFSPDIQDAAAAAATGKLKSGMKKRSRPKSKYQV